MSEGKELLDIDDFDKWLDSKKKIITCKSQLEEVIIQILELVRIEKDEARRDLLEKVEMDLIDSRIKTCKTYINEVDSGDIEFTGRLKLLTGIKSDLKKLEKECKP